MLQILLSGSSKGPKLVPPPVKPKKPPVLPIPPPLAPPPVRPVVNPPVTPTKPPERKENSYDKWIKQQEKEYGKSDRNEKELTQKQPTDQKQVKENKQDTKEKVDKEKTDDKAETITDLLISKLKADRMKEMQEQQVELEKLANEESISLTTNHTFVKDLLQTVPASINEIKETAKSVISVGKKIKEFGLELYNDPIERHRLVNNYILSMEHLKKTAVDYYESGKLKDDIIDLKNKVRDMNNQFTNDLWRDPVKTTKEYLTTVFGGHFYNNAFDFNKPLGERLLNLGAGYIKTIFALGTIESGHAFTVLVEHQKALISQKLAPYIPGLLDDGKNKIIIEGLKITVHNKLKEYIGKPKETTMVHNLNDFLDRFNDGYMNNGVFVHYADDEY